MDKINLKIKMQKSKLDSKIQILKEILRKYKSLVIAYSGGVDSTFLAKVATDTLGRKNVLCVTANSETYPKRELADSKRFAKALGLAQRVMDTSELSIKGFSDNPPDRCYFCKGELFGKLKEMASGGGFGAVCDGANADDPNGHRPGIKAAREKGVISPLMDAGLSKDEIRALSKRMGLPTWDKPSFACLSSRFPYYEKITGGKLKRVESAEEFLKSLGVGQLRVRSHGDIARIEVVDGNIERLSSKRLRKKVVDRLKSLGYKYITIDLEGYRTGSMNEILSGVSPAKSRRRRDEDGAV